MVNKNILLYYILNFLQACVFTTPIWAFFFTLYLNFNISIAISIILLSWVFSTLLEVPSGAWADRLGRKKMFILWLVFIWVAESIWLFSTTLPPFIFSAIFLGTGFALVSWNYEALLHDDLEERWEEKRFKDITANWYIAKFIWRALSSFLAGYLFLYDPLLPSYLTVWAYLLAILLAFFIHNPKQVQSNHNNNYSHISETIGFIYQNKNIFIFILLFIVYGWINNLFWFTYQPLFASLNISIWYIWIIFSVIGIFSAVWSHIIKELQNRFSENTIIKIIFWSLVLTWLLISSFQIYLVAIGVILMAIKSWFIFPFANKYLLEHSPKHHKSTILSIFSLGFTFSYTILGIIWWFFIDIYWLQLLYYINTLWIIILFWYTFILPKTKFLSSKKAYK